MTVGRRGAPNQALLVVRMASPKGCDMASHAAGHYDEREALGVLR